MLIEMYYIYKIIIKIFRILHILFLIDDEKFLKMYYYVLLKKKLDLCNPKTFNEKLQWLKLYDRNPEYTKMVDKYEAKKYVSDIIGEEYIIPTLGIYDKFDDIDFEKLPNQFVIKCTHDSGGIIICKDKNEFDIEKARKKINKSLKKNYYWSGREWPYKKVKPRILIEKYMRNGNDQELIDYKFFCFNGIPEYIEVHYDRYLNHLSTLYDINWNNINSSTVNDPKKSKEIEKPDNYELMKKISNKLSKDMVFVRIDLYDINNKIYFGEITFYPAGGCLPFNPSQWDSIFGNLIKLP